MPSVDSVDIYSIWWYGWKALSLSFPKLFADWKSIEYYESYGQKCVDVFCIDSVDIDSIECIRDPWLVLKVSTYIVLIYLSIDRISAFQNFLQIENRLNIMKVMGRNV